jgi:hypothetical protein
MPGTNPPGYQGLLTRLDGYERRIRALEGQQNRPIVWADLPLATNWANFGSVYQTAQYAIDALGFVIVRGMLIKSVAWIQGETIATLPIGQRPAASERFSNRGGDATNGGLIFSLDIATSGAITIGGAVPTVGSPGTVLSLALSGIRFQQGN